MIRRLARPTLRVVATATALLALLVPPPATFGCPFCSAVQSTLTEEIALADVIVIARLATPLAPDEPGDASVSGLNANPSLATFTIDKVLKGNDLLGDTKSFSLQFFGNVQQGDMFMAKASGPTKLSWLPPMRIDQRQQDYLLQLMALPKEGPERLAFFQRYLQDPDALLAEDAYGEFARAPYSTVKQLKPKMNHDLLVKWIQDPETPASKRGLYLTMLGVCGSKDDLPMLEKRMRSSDPPSKSGLDALIACYLTLRGPAGVAVVEDLFLEKRDDNFSGDYADVYAAIMALRFHGMENEIVPRSRVLQAFARLLDHPQMANLIVPDLARWEDWSHLDRLVVLFKNADAKSSYIRVPIIHYARACPLPAAKQALADFEKTDPEAVQRAAIFFPPGADQSK